MVTKTGVLIAVLMAAAAVWAQSDSTLTSTELALEAPESALKPLAAVAASDAGEVVIEAIVERGYQDEQGRYVVDVLERDQAYLGVRITTTDGRPVQGAVPNIEVEGASRLVLPELVSAEDGVLSFGVVGGQMGLDTVKASIGDSSVEFMINVISLRAAGFPTLPSVEGILPWSDLMQAQLEYDEMVLRAKFSPEVQAQAGKTVKLSGFMMPLDPDLKQKHFLLTSNPPSCFFHIPGGPAGSVEVLADEGIEVSWNPIVIEGRFEPQASSDIGVVYRLLDARLVNP